MGRYKGISTSVPSADSATAYKRKHRICVNFLLKINIYTNHASKDVDTRFRGMSHYKVLKQEHFKVDYMKFCNGHTGHDFHLLG